MSLEGRPTIYKGTQMRSRLESRFAAFLDELGLPWEYEPVCFADDAGEYLPDFRTLVGGSRLYVEVKPIGFDEDAVKRRMAIVWSSEPSVQLAIASPDDRAFWSFPVGRFDDDGAHWERLAWAVLPVSDTVGLVPFGTFDSQAMRSPWVGQPRWMAP